MMLEKNVRTGLFDHFTYLRLMKALPTYLKPMVRLACRPSMRWAGILNLTWGQVDSCERVIRLAPPPTSKNDSPRIVPPGQEL